MTDRNELPDAFSHLKDMTQLGILATAFHEMFQAFQEAGFTREEAFELVKTSYEHSFYNPDS